MSRLSNRSRGEKRLPMFVFISSAVTISTLHAHRFHGFDFDPGVFTVDAAAVKDSTLFVVSGILGACAFASATLKRVSSRDRIWAYGTFVLIAVYWRSEE